MRRPRWRGLAAACGHATAGGGSARPRSSTAPLGLARRLRERLNADDGGPPALAEVEYAARVARHGAQGADRPVEPQTELAALLAPTSSQLPSRLAAPTMKWPPTWLASAHTPLRICSGRTRPRPSGPSVFVSQGHALFLGLR